MLGFPKNAFSRSWWNMRATSSQHGNGFRTSTLCIQSQERTSWISCEPEIILRCGLHTRMWVFSEFFFPLSGSLGWIKTRFPQTTHFLLSKPRFILSSSNILRERAILTFLGARNSLRLHMEEDGHGSEK